MTSEVAALQQALLAALTESGALTRREVAAAFRAVPRHYFLPGVPLAEVYRDEAIPTRFDPETGAAISSSSQPAIMAIMLEQLDVTPGQRVLEIGAGTGYNAAVLAQLVGPGGRVVSVDIDEDVAAAAREHLQTAGVEGVEVITGDGGYGYAPGAPYDRIILTASAWDLPPAWHQQLKPGGRLVLPLAITSGPQKSIALERAAEADRPLLYRSLSVVSCGFMPLRGAFAGPERVVALMPDNDYRLASAADLPLPAAAIGAWVLAGGSDQPVGLQVTYEEIWSGLGLWLSMRPDYCTVTAEDAAVEENRVPCLLEFAGRRTTCFTAGLLQSAGLALLGRVKPAGQQGQGGDAKAPFELMIRSFGSGQQADVAEALAQSLRDWDAAGRPGGAGLRLRVYDAGAGVTPAADEVVIDKKWTRLVLNWDEPERT